MSVCGGGLHCRRRVYSTWFNPGLMQPTRVHIKQRRKNKLGRPLCSHTFAPLAGGGAEEGDGGVGGEVASETRPFASQQRAINGRGALC